MGREKRIKIIKKIQEQRRSKIFCYLTSDRQNAQSHFAKDVLPIFAEHLDENGYNKIDLLIFTLGGDTLAAFGLNRLLREYTDNLNALIPDKCHSAGTLFSLGCNQIMMSKVSSLGPIDPSMNNPLNPAIKINGQIQTLPLSVESVAGFKGLVKDEWGIKEGSDLSTILKLLSEKVHPLALGDVYRIRQQIENLAMTLLEQHRDDKENIRNIVQKLTKELGSHDYLIFRKEAKNLLENQVVIDEKLGQPMRDLYKDFANEMDLGKPYNPNLILSSLSQKPPRVSSVELKLATIESEGRCDQFIERRSLKEIQINHPSAPPRVVVQEEIQSSGWEQSYN